jgi:hypothetical protein
LRKLTKLALGKVSNENERGSALLPTVGADLLSTTRPPKLVRVDLSFDLIK